MTERRMSLRCKSTGQTFYFARRDEAEGWMIRPTEDIETGFNLFFLRNGTIEDRPMPLIPKPDTDDWELVFEDREQGR